LPGSTAVLVLHSFTVNVEHQRNSSSLPPCLGEASHRERRGVGTPICLRAPVHASANGRICKGGRGARPRNRRPLLPPRLCPLPGKGDHRRLSRCGRGGCTHPYVRHRTSPHRCFSLPVRVSGGERGWEVEEGPGVGGG
jgi:hypothetical protein